MRLLLDTHALLWFHEGSSRLPATVSRRIADTRNECLVSAASIWELAIKLSLGKLRLPMSLDAFVRQKVVNAGFGVLPIELPHLSLVSDMPWHHRDPFDRLLVAQCLQDGLSLVSHDATLDAYGLKRVWS